jgi:hypothetical protein
VSEQPSDAALLAVRLAQELRDVEPIRDSAWLTPEVVDALERLIAYGIIAPAAPERGKRTCWTLCI